MKAYYVKYRLDGIYSKVSGIQVPADNKTEALDKATYELIPQKEGTLPFMAWVNSVTYNNGRVHYFDTLK